MAIQDRTTRMRTLFQIVLSKSCFTVLHERSNITASFAEPLKLKKKRFLHMHFGLIVAN